MSNRARKAKTNIDYGVFHRTGQKIVKGVIMDPKQKQIKEIQIREDIEEHFKLLKLMIWKLLMS